jgi:hypothetical protein
VVRTIYAKHEPYRTGHLGKVVEEMKLTGPPTIRVMEFDGKWFAVEGSHRLAACDILGFCPKIVVLREDSEGLDAHWAEVAKDLPEYNFEYVLKFDMGLFEDEIRAQA